MEQANQANQEANQAQAHEIIDFDGGKALKILPSGEILVNRTKHEIVLFDGTKQKVIFVFPSHSSQDCVIEEDDFEVKNHLLSGIIPLNEKKYKPTIKNLPEKRDGVFLIVGGMIVSALKEQRLDREDILYPDTGTLASVRKDGKILGTTRFNVYVPTTI